MKKFAVFVFSLMLFFAVGCGSSTKVRARFVSHKQQGEWCAICYEVYWPTNLVGHYGIEGTWRTDLGTNINGQEWEFNVNQGGLGSPIPLFKSKPGEYIKPTDYFISEPPQYGDFLSHARRIK